MLPSHCTEFRFKLFDFNKREEIKFLQDWDREWESTSTAEMCLAERNTEAKLYIKEKTTKRDDIFLRLQHLILCLKKNV